jgi:16S rRNA (guanine527-N7)-methyltransferase
MREDHRPPGASKDNAGSGVTQRAGQAPTAPPPGREPLPTCVRGLPPLPPEYGAVLEATLPAIAAAGAAEAALSDAARRAIDDHVRLLLAWNEAINLSGIREPGAIALEHVLDSLTALPLLRRAGVDELVDLGSGAGYPGLPLAAALPARRALLVDSVAKKARFIETAVQATGLAPRVAVAAARAESLAADPHHRGRWQAVVARAVAELAELAELGLPLLAPGGILVAWKRLPCDEELARAQRVAPELGGRLSACHTVVVPGLEDHALAVIEKIAPTPAQYPRQPAVRHRRPL